VKVLDIDKKAKRVIFSERAVSEAKDVSLELKAMKKISEGDIFEGIVTQITGFGAFVRIDVEVGKKKIPVEGLVHISELSWQKVGKVGDMLSAGDSVNVVVIGVEDGKVALSMKKALRDPWDDVDIRYKPEMRIKGKVVRKSGYGLFVELEPGVEGLVHITKIPPGTDYKKGDEIEVYVEEVNKDERKISLGLVLTSKPIGYK
jgi:ribosomal protein S1